MPPHVMRCFLILGGLESHRRRFCVVVVSPVGDPLLPLCLVWGEADGRPILFLSRAESIGTGIAKSVFVLKWELEMVGVFAELRRTEVSSQIQARLG